MHSSYATSFYIVVLNLFTGLIRDEELATELAWVVVYLTALSNVATSVLARSDLLQIVVDRLASSYSLQLLIPVMGIICRLYNISIQDSIGKTLQMY